MFEIALLRSIERSVGAEGLRQVLEAAGLSDDDLVPDFRSWSDIEKIVRIAEASTAVTGDPDPGWRAGEELMRVHRSEGIHLFVQAAGGPAEALVLVADYASKTSGEQLMSVVETGDDHVILESVYRGPGALDRFFCRLQAAYYGTVPTLFGAVGAVAESRCSAGGDDRCRYRISWQGKAHRTADAVARSRGLINRFEELQNIASELALAPDVETALERIVDRVRAGTAVAGLGYLIAASLTPGAPVRVHHRGLSDDDAREAADLVVTGRLDDRFGMPLVVDIESASNRYGHLVAFFPPDTTVTDIDRRLLGAYAAHAAASLEAAHTLEQARRDRDTAQALLALAHSLARSRTVTEVARRIAETIPAVVPAKDGSVCVWDPDTQQLRPVARVARSAMSFPAMTVPTLKLDRVEELARDGRPVIYTAERVPEMLHPHLAETATVEIVAAPILARSDFLGFVVAGFPEPVEADRRDDVLDRLAALADQAGSALDNARLVEHVRHQALHDTLTGLPNRVLVEDRVRQTLARIPRGGPGAALLFVDVDHFKEVNDTLGHDAGDELLRQLGARFQTCLRTADTLARIGGDEFLVFVPGNCDPRDAAAVAEKLVEVTRAPVDVGRAIPLHVTISVGIALTPQHGDDYETLLRRADAAMYAAKAAGRDNFRMYGTPLPG